MPNNDIKELNYWSKANFKELKFGINLFLNDLDHLTSYRSQDLATLLIIGSSLEKEIYTKKMQIRVVPDLYGIKGTLQQTVLVLVVLFGFSWLILIFVSKCRDETVVTIPSNITSFLIGAPTPRGLPTENGIFIKWNNISKMRRIERHGKKWVPNSSPQEEGLIVTKSVWKDTWENAWMLCIIVLISLLYFLSFLFGSDRLVSCLNLPESLCELLFLGSIEILFCYVFACIWFGSNGGHYYIAPKREPSFRIYSPPCSGNWRWLILLGPILNFLFFSRFFPAWPEWMTFTVVLLGIFPLVVYGFNTLVILNVPPNDTYSIMTE